MAQAILASLIAFLLTVAAIWEAAQLIARWRNPRLRRLLGSVTPTGVPPQSEGVWFAGSASRSTARVVTRLLQLADVPPGDSPPGLRTRRQRLLVTGWSVVAACALAAVAWRITRGVSMPWTASVAASLVAGWLGLRLSVRTWIRLRARQWSATIDTSLIDVLDLWVLCLGAGMSFQSALVRVAEDAFLAGRAVQQELWLTYQELTAGCPRDEALRHFARRCGNLPDVNALVAQVIQAERLGGSLAQTLKVYAGTLRVKRYQAAREQIHTLPVRLAFPLVFCILPALFVVILGPSLIRLYGAFTSQ